MNRATATPQRKPPAVVGSALYFRDIDLREVDFVLTKNRRPTHFIECKYNDGPISAGLRYLKERFASVEAIQASAVGTKDYLSAENIRVCPATKFLSTLI